MTVAISIGARDRIHLRSEFSWDTVAACKRIPGANWAKAKGVWTFPLTIESCMMLRKEFGNQLRVERDVSDWFKAERAKRDELGALSGATTAELKRVPDVSPRLAAAMASRSYQPVAARFIADGRSVLIADDPGLGKTLEAIGGVIESGEPGPYLVVCPKTAVESVWAREIPRWWPGQNVITVPEGRAARDSILTGLANVARMREEDVARGADSLMTLESTWVVVHPEMILARKYWECRACEKRTQWTRKPTPVLKCGHAQQGTKVLTEHTFPQLFAVEWGAIIFDESHEVLVMKSGTPTQRRIGADLLRLREGGLRIAASGTPWRSRPENLWGTLNWLDPKTYSGKWRWVGAFWELGGYSGYEVKGFKPDAEPMLWDSLKPIVLRRTKSEVAKDLPPKQYVGSLLDPSDPESPVGIWLGMTPKQRDAYEQMVKSSIASIDGGDLQAVGVLAEMTRLRQFAASYGEIRGGEFHPTFPSNKFEHTLQLLHEMGYPDSPTGKVVIVSQSTKLLKLFRAELEQQMKGDLGTCMIDGSISGHRREQIRLAFNEPVGSGPHLLFLQIKAGGVAITIDSADDMVVLDERDADSMTQVEDRLHRVSNPRQVRYHYLRSLGTVDVGAAKINAMRDSQGRRLLDERRGVIYLRAVLEASVA